VTDFAGQAVKPKPSDAEPQAHQKADIEIIKYLAGHGTLFAKEKLIHSYPHCWRCDTPLLNYATSSWFVKVTDLKDRLVALNDKVVWKPKEIGQGRFGKWLEGAKDWAISRSRFWGAPLPVWICNECNDKCVCGSIDELVQKSGMEPKNRNGVRDLHRPYIDEVTWKCSCGGTMKRVPEVFDTWYESGSMPFSQIHYPFEHAENIDKKLAFPADFIAEGQDQTRGWFYSLLVLSTALFDTAPYKNVVVNGIILAEDGQKMSKRLKNYPELNLVLDKYGAYALRYYLIASPAVKAEDVAFTERGLDEVVKKLLLRLENVFTFYKPYQIQDEEIIKKFSRKNEEMLNPEKMHSLDQWILARLDELTHTVTEALEQYELDRAAKPFMLFVDDLSTWYVRRSRDRFKGENTADREQAALTTRHVLLQLSKLLAPFMPFVAEDLYQNILGRDISGGAAARETAADAAESVHLESWPLSAQSAAQTAAHTTSQNSAQNATQPAPILAAMEHVRKIVSLALEARAAAGIKIRQPLQKLTLKQALFAEEADLIEILKDEINVKEIVIDAQQQGDIQLDTTITPVLKREGEIRDIIRSIQDFRKATKQNAFEHISMSVSATAYHRELIESAKDEIMKATMVTISPISIFQFS
jgi:isoleucyl-tRNA synthetase